MIPGSICEDERFYVFFRNGWLQEAFELKWIRSRHQRALRAQGNRDSKMSRAAAVALVMVALAVAAIHAQARSFGQFQIKDKCSSDAGCGNGLYCSSCLAAGVTQPICVRSSVRTPVETGLPFNKYAWLTTHNSFAISSEKQRFPVPRLAPTNQEDSVTSQLQNGVRGLMLDMYDFQNDVWLCHSFGGKCYDFTAFRPALETLLEIGAFLSANPKEIITIFIEDYVSATNGLTKLFNSAGLKKYWFPVSKMPKSGDWPTTTDMIANNQRLIVFTSRASKEASEGIAYQWRYTAENQYGDGGMKAGNCPNRAESPPLASSSVSLVVENYFPTAPSESQACKDHSNGLFDMLNVCSQAAGNRWSNFLAVDYYKRSVGGGAFQAVDTLNAKLKG